MSRFAKRTGRVFTLNSAKRIIGGTDVLSLAGTGIDLGLTVPSGL